MSSPSDDSASRVRFSRDSLVPGRRTMVFCKSCFICAIGVASLALLIASIALVLTQVFQDIVNSRVKQEIILKNGTEAFETWEKPPPPIYMQFYFFHVVNPAEILTGEKPVVKQKGPYTYREFRIKENVDFLDNNTKVSANSKKTYVFVPEMSVSEGDDDFIRTVNVPAVTLMEKFKSNSVFANLISSYMKSINDGLFVTKTVKEFLWGYKDPLLSAVHKFLPTVEEYFGFFYKANATDDGTYTFLTGENDFRDFARIIEWQNKSSLTWWSSDSCNKINGTDGSSFHPLINKSETIYIFSSDMCRSLYAAFEKEVSVNKIPAYRFIIPKEVFANASINPANAGFCVPDGNCLGSGLLNVSKCKQDAPIIMSSPHFYQADEKFVNDIVGMNPNKEDHETSMDINPLTGILLRGEKRLQLNIFVEKIPSFSQTGNVRTLIFPLMYINESVVIDATSADKVRSVVNQANVVMNIPFMIMALGIIFGVLFIALVCKARTSEVTLDDQVPIIQSAA
ncbi:lysosome membrane protein 2-like [Polypterus senegalus]|uniref:lysosome membrane protein 2-like n=1 Tax=Polypterus senegalus TaxID=55291 RepID=UPI00196385F4|nr:lysosome membrane protein 2-like [Polypterus senegalus]